MFFNFVQDANLLRHSWYRVDRWRCEHVLVFVDSIIDHASITEPRIGTIVNMNDDVDSARWWLFHCIFALFLQIITNELGFFHIMFNNHPLGRYRILNISFNKRVYIPNILLNRKDSVQCV